MPNLYNRSHNSYYHPPNPAYATSVFSTTVNNPPIALMNYFNATNRMPLPSCPENPVVENSFLQQQLHVDMVITHIFFTSYMHLNLPPHFSLFFQDLSQVKLSKLSCDDLVHILGQVNELKGTIDTLGPILKENAITGKVLMYCDLNELKSVSTSNIKILNSSLRCRSKMTSNF